MKTLLGALRLPFLLLTPVCVFLGYSTAKMSGAPISFGDVLLVFIGALAAHISVNTLNEYLDFRSGLDAITPRTPFSGGSGSLIQNPSAAPVVFGAAVISLLLTTAIGVYFLLSLGPMILPIGLTGIVIIITYTQWLNRYPWPCLLAPGLGFGTLMVLGTQLVLAGQLTSLAVLASMVPFFLVNNVLLLNQFPDREADAQVGRRHFVIAYGLKPGVICFGLFMVATVVVILSGIGAEVFPPLAVIALVPLLAGLVAVFGAARFAWMQAPDIARLLPFMALNVATALLTVVFLGIALLLG